MPITNTGAESNGISAHGTIITRAPLGSGSDEAIGELRDITAPSLTRNPIETTTHNSDDDSYVVGIRRKGELQFTVNFLPSADESHNSVDGLLQAWATGQKDLYKVNFPDGAIWQFSGFVSNISATMPVDGALEAQISIRPSGGQIITP
jgi:hypothetical protein